MSRYDRDALLAATDLVALADELLGPHRGTAASPAWRCPSPTHAQTGRTPPLTVFPGRRGEQRWHCHGCGVGGTAVDLLVVAYGWGVGEALDALATRAGVRPGDPPPPPIRRPAAPSRARGVSDPDGLEAYVNDCARRLFEREGRAVLVWLTRDRGIPEEILVRNRVGADAGVFLQPRPEGVPEVRSVAAVFPVVEDGRAVFAQVRLRSPPPEFAKYLNLKASFAPNPKVGFYEPVEPVGECVVVTEGPTDALSAAAAGYRGAAVLGTGAACDADGTAARRLARLDGQLVVAFDPDPAGARASVTFLERLRDLGRHPARLHVPATRNDLNEWMCSSDDWPATFQAAVRGATRASRERTVSRALDALTR